ncbi:MAG TPA: DegT/DnrJ/EryC1/StrS family aminotransferase [Kofleriaceae bacterium]|jgi:dTDP-4-amino-4,6-dideoxygalactose transaminase
MSKIPLVDLRAQYESIKPEIDAAICAVIETTAFIGGPDVKAFEQELAAFCEVPHAVGCANGTDALHVVLHALGIGPGDEVITVPNTFIATAEAISMAGATPVFVDVVEATALMDPSKVAAAITARTKAIMPVHLYGQPADVDAIVNAAPGLPIIEDAAQAHGARLRGRRAGSIGIAGTFSFYPGKNLGAYGDGGAMTFRDDAALAKRCAMLRDHGRMDKYLHELPGFNSRLDTIQAAILRVKLAHLEAWNAARRKIAGWYLERLAGTPGLQLPHVPTGVEPVWHLFVVNHEQRERLRIRMSEAGIGVGIHYPVPLHMQPAYAHLGYAKGRFPVAEKLSATCLSLPIYAELSEADVDRVARSLREAL